MKTNSWPYPWLAALNRFLTGVYRLYRCNEEQSPLRAARTVRLARGTVVSLTCCDGVGRVRVLDGTAWLTGTRGGGDVLLRTRDQISLSGPGPFVIEALGDLEMELQAS